jgi:hypothetical protein
MNGDLWDEPPWADPQIPAGVDGKHIYEYAVAVGGRRRRRRRQRRAAGLAILSVVMAAPVIGLVSRQTRGAQIVVAGPTSSSTTVPAIVKLPPNPLADQVLALGDSVMLGAEPALEREIPNMYVDAKVTRQFSDATAALQEYKKANLLPPTIVIHMGTNGAFSDAQFDEIMSVVGKREVFFVNLREPRPWETEVNQRLAVDVKKYENAHLLDWHRYGGSHDDWFTVDGIHLTGPGALGYADFIRDNLIRSGLTSAVTPASTTPSQPAPSMVSSSPPMKASLPDIASPPTTNPLTIVRITVSGKDTLGSGESFKVVATAVLANGQLVSPFIAVTWSVNDSSIASITSDGLLGPAKKTGLITVTAAYRPTGSDIDIEGSIKIRATIATCTRTTVTSTDPSTTFAIAVC